MASGLFISSLFNNSGEIHVDELNSVLIWSVKCAYLKQPIFGPNLSSSKIVSVVSFRWTQPFSWIYFIMLATPKIILLRTVGVTFSFLDPFDFRYSLLFASTVPFSIYILKLQYWYYLRFEDVNLRWFFGLDLLGNNNYLNNAG